MIAAAVYIKELCEQAIAKLEHAPAMLTASDVEQLRIVDPALAVRAAAARVRTEPAAAPARALSGLTSRDVDGIANGVAGIVVESEQRVRALIAALEARIAGLEAEATARRETQERAPGWKYRGVFAPSSSYVADDVVTHSGSTWIALRATAGPGFDHACWQLMCKRGRDGKAGKDGKDGGA